MEIERITPNELAAIIGDPKLVKGSTFIGFDAVTVMKLNKTLGSRTIPNPHFGRIRKVLDGQVGMLFSDTNTNGYENMVNRRLGMEGAAPTFEVGERAWGEKLPNTSLLVHTPKETGVPTNYLFVIYNQSPVTLADRVAEMGIVLNEHDQALIDAMKARVVAMESKGRVQYLYVKDDGTTEPIAYDDIQGKPPAKSEGKQGGLSEDLKVVPRSFKMSSIVRVTMGGKTYLVGNN